LGTAGTRAAIGTVIGVAICAGGTGASAQEWVLESNISQQVLYSDNLLLSRQREVETVGFITTPALHLERNSPTSQIAFDGRFQFAEYIDHSDFNSQDQLLNLQVDQALSERAAFRLGAAFTHDTTLKSEQDVTGRFLDDSIEFISWNVGPGFAYQLTPVDEMVVRGNYRETTYFDTDEKTDYKYFGPGFDFRHQLNELEAVTATVGATRFIPDEPGDDYTDTISTLFGYSYTSSERFSISGGVGVAYSWEHEDPGPDNEDLGFRLKFNMNYDISDQTTTRVSLSHDNEPSGDGDQVVRNRVVIGLDHQLTPLTTARLNLDYVDNVDIIGEEGDETSDEGTSRYTSVRPAIAWQLTEDWSVEAQYRFRYRLFDDDGGDAMSNSVFLTLQYNFPTWAGTGF
jgi:hypothetical protein